jgi:poly-gamma-glutamate capsule biosynthesis protein CapA/YwtB (metallophosphatase superfamily)
VEHGDSGVSGPDAGPYSETFVRPVRRVSGRSFGTYCAMITLALTGDVMLGRKVAEVLDYHMRPEAPWGDVMPLLDAADLRIINLECAITDKERPWTRTPKVFHFRAQPSAIETLRTARIDACSLANNHTLDFEEQGLLDTLEHLDTAGIRHAGAGRNREQAADPAILNVPADHARRVALLAFTDNEPPFAAGIDRPGTNYLPVSLKPEVLRRVERTVSYVREMGVDTVIFSNHWGPNMVQRPKEIFRRFARAVIDRGVDFYYGHSAHVFQGVEIYRGKPILYDTGDFIDDYVVDPKLRNDWSFLFQVSVEEGRLERLDLTPLKLSYARVDLAAGGERESILDRMERLSAEMGTFFARREGALVLERG